MVFALAKVGMVIDTAPIAAILTPVVNIDNSFERLVETALFSIGVVEVIINP